MNPPPPVVPRPLRRSTSDRILGGVCGGLGRYWNVDPIILRVAFGVSLLVGGFGLFLYLALWLLVPDDTAPADQRVSESWGLRVLGVVAAAVTVMIGLGLLFSDSLGGGGVLLGAAAAGIVVWIVMSQGSPRARAEQPEPGYAYGGVSEYTPAAAVGQPSPSRPPRERSYLGLIGLLAAMAAGGVALLFSSSPTVVLASSLLALGLTMVVGGFAGRARWLLVFTVPLVMLLATVSQIERTDFTAGEIRWSPTAADTSYDLTAGSLTVDFSQWQGEPVDPLTIDVIFGQVVLEAPRNWDLQVNTDFGAGAVEVDGEPVAASVVNGRERVVVPASDGTADATMVVDVSLQAGAVMVQTGAPAVGPPLAAEQPAAEREQAKSKSKTKKEKAA